MTEQAKRIVILGAGSAIAEATARIWAAEGARLVLVGRDITRLGQIAADLKTRGAIEAVPWPLDCAAQDSAAHLEDIVQTLGGLDVLLLAYGVLGEQGELERDPKAVAAIIQTNFTSAVGWCLATASVLETQRAGSLLVIGSVAGDRGRQSNFVYGATKGGLGRLVEGLAHKLAPLGARAVLIKPGFVDTPMTANVPNRRGPLWARPQDIAPLIAVAARRGGPVLYVPRVWWAIMLVVRNLPTCLFNRLRI
jgi:decaprenylphospho-beta-D-erythro-pentofuranosid-2-ulose 2-reductase